MSFGLPDFGTHRSDDGARAFRIIRGAGFLLFAYVLGVALLEGRAALLARRSIEKSRAEVAVAKSSAEELARGLQKNPDALIATASLESSPSRVWRDLNSILPVGVSVVSLKVDYLQDASARLDFSVLAASPAAYDRFLASLSKSPAFTAIKPGSESRPGLVRASVSAVHRPGAGAQ